jgi:formylmethanofuran dehydrogenase subunit C
MSGWRLSLKQPPRLRVDLRSLAPLSLAAHTADAIAKLPLHHGRETLALGDLFDVAPHANGELLLEGDLSKCDRIGWQLAGGTLRIDGAVGDYLGAAMSAGEIVCSGSAGLLAACEMSGGRLDIGGDAGDFAASALPGSMDGMRGGTLLVRGNAGARFGDRMRRGNALVFGDAGDFLASRMVAGSIAVAGRVGAHVGYGMRRGSIVCAGPAPAVPATFVPNDTSIAVFWHLLATSLARHGGAFADLAARRAERHLGDLAAAGKGELLLCR